MCEPTANGEQLENDLQRLLGQITPRRLLCIDAGPCCPPLRRYAEQHGTSLRLLSATTLDQLGTEERFDFAFIADTLEYLPKTAAEQLLARLRDRHGGRFAVLLPLGEKTGQHSRWTESDLLAFGMVRLGRYGGGGCVRHLYGFDLATYKPTPEWLNPRFWANPERWDKAWW